MNKRYLTADTIKKEFVEPVEVSSVTESVYKVTDPDGGNLRYAKVWLDHSTSELEEIMSINADIGMPRHELIKRDPHIVVMDPVSGDPLPRVLLKALIPGVWSVCEQRLVRIFEKLGRTIGRLHYETQRGTESLDPLNLSFDNYDAITNKGLADPVQGRLDDTVVKSIESRLTELSEHEIPTCIVHGDLMLFHIYAGDNTISLIDFDAAKKVPCIDDIIRLMSALELFIERVPYARRTQFQRLCSAFQAGYDEVGLPYTIDKDMFDLLRTIRHCSLLMYYHVKLTDNFSNNEESMMRNKTKLRVLRQIDTVLLKKIIPRIVT